MAKVSHHTLALRSGVVPRAEAGLTPPHSPSRTQQGPRPQPEVGATAEPALDCWLVYHCKVLQATSTVPFLTRAM